MNYMLLSTAASLGVFHTVISIDHYVPFAVMSKANGWSYSRTMLIVFICGAGHVMSSLILGLCGIWLGSHISVLAGINDFREEAAAWFMLIFGLIYMIWGIYSAAGNKPHRHLHPGGAGIRRGHSDAHVHGDAHEHSDEHSHSDGHGHGVGHGHGDERRHSDERRHGVGHGHGDERRHRDERRHDIDHHHEAAHSAQDHENASASTGDVSNDAEKGLSHSFWPMFIMLVLCPSQALIPVLIYPAAQSGMLAVAVVALVFAVFTIGAMLVCTTIALKGVNALPVEKLGRYAHALAGFVIFACGAAARFLGI